MNNKIILEKYFKKIDNDVFVISINNFEDFRAVLSAKVSREILLERKKILNVDDVEKFLLKNLAGYNHASIGEMCCLTIYHFGFGWISSYLLVDEQLFIGQEVSSRAVDCLKRINKPCYDAEHLPNIKQNFLFFSNIFIQNKNKFINNNIKSYKFDYIRWALPGTVSTGVIFNLNARILSRHLNSLSEFNFMSKVIKKFKFGFKYIAPNLFKSLDKKRININHQKYISKIFNFNLNILNNIKLKWINKPSEINIKKLLKYFLSKYKKYEKLEYLPKEFKLLGLFELNIKCSIAAARDWHRHRVIIPWNLKLVLNKDNLPFIHDAYLKYGYKKYKKNIQNFFSKNKEIQFILSKKQLNWIDLYYFPFGTTVLLTGYGTLDYIFYMLKLRSKSSNANFEYKQQADFGIKQLISILPKVLIEWFHIK